MDLSYSTRRDLRDATRLAIQSAVAGAGIYILMQTFGLPEKFIGVLSAVLVVQPSVGNTLWAGTERVLATLVGCAVGVVCLILLPNGYGTAAALGFSMLVMNAIAGFRPQWRYGVVAAVALAMGSESSALDTAIERSFAIGIGVAFGVLVSLIVWPDRASARSERHLRRALDAIAGRLDIALRAARSPETSTDDKENNRRIYHQEIQAARDAANAVRIADNEVLLERITHVEQLYNSVLILNRVAEETDQVAGDSQELDEDLDAVRELTCKVAKGLSNGDHDQDGRRKKIRRLLEDIRDRFVSARDDARDHVLRNALVFGLLEVHESIERLLESYGAGKEQESKSPVSEARA